MPGRHLLALGLLLALGVVLATHASAGPSSHPYFDDGGALTWYRDYDQARSAARAQGKLIFIEYGRRICGSCAKLCRTTLGSSSIKHRLGEVAVGLAAECDHPDPRVKALFRRHLAGARTLPFCGFVTPDGQWVSGFAGYKDPGSFLGHVGRAESMKPRPPGPTRSQAPRARVPEHPPRIARRPTPRPNPAPRPDPRPAPVRTPEFDVARGPMPAPRVQPAPQAQPTPRRAPTPIVRPAEPRRERGTLARKPAVAKPTPERVNTGYARRPLQPRPAPEPMLSGDPDAVAIAPPRTPDAATRRLPKPRVVILPPVKVDPAPYAAPRPAPAPARLARAPAPAPATQMLGRRAQDLARNGKWHEVLQLCAKEPGDPASARLSRQAHTWAGDLLDEAVEAAGRSDYTNALKAIEKVIQEMAGEPEYVDGARGLSAIKALLELRYLDPKGAVAPAVRRQAYEDLRGTRWAILFAA